MPSQLKKVLNYIPSSPSFNFLRSLRLFDINHDTIIPSFFNHQLILFHLALILHPQIGGDDALKKIGLDYLEEGEEGEDGADGFEASDAFEGDEENDVDVEILDVPPLVFKTPRKKSAVRVKEKIDDSFFKA